MQFSTLAALFLSATASIAAPVEEKRQVSNVSPITPAEASRVRNAFSSAGIVPTLIPTIDPRMRVNIQYPSVIIDLGTQTETAQTALTPPAYSFSPEAGAPADATYSFFMVDPDVPSPNGLPVVGVARLNFLHWYISGVRAGVNPGGNTVASYFPTTPASPGEQHRYTWLVYREPAGYTPNPISPNLRGAFDLNGYVRRAGLGQPLGGNFMRQSITNGIVPEGAIPPLPSVPLPTVVPPGIISRDEE